MEKEAITVIAQMLTAMKDAISALEKAQKEKDLEKENRAKKEILNLKDQLDRVI